jgi:hypothetical protein
MRASDLHAAVGTDALCGGFITVRRQIPLVYPLALSDIARGLKVTDMVRPLTKMANFFKHADRDPSAKIDLEDDDVEVLLFLACHDFGRVARGMPIAAQVFEAWAYAAATKRVSDAPARRSDLVDEIMSHESATMAGLVVIARAVVMELSDWWTSEYCEHDAARVFMEAFCSFAGIRPAPLQYAEAQ